MIVQVPPVIPALGLYPSTYVIRDVAEADRKLVALLADIEAVAERWLFDTAALCRTLQAWCAVDALLGARLEVERQEAGTAESLHALWVLSWPGTAAPSGDLLDQSSEVAA